MLPDPRPEASFRRMVPLESVVVPDHEPRLVLRVKVPELDMVRFPDPVMLPPLKV
jgi:hypothetical protein